MNINLDDDIRQSRIKPSESNFPISLSQLFFIIVIGVFIANMFSWGAQRGIEYVIAKEMMKQASNELAEITARNKDRAEEQRKINAKIEKQRQLKNEKKQAGYRQAMETCNFWRDQYRSAQTSSNKYQRDQACNFVNEFR